jgi:hypothetical protein
MSVGGIEKTIGHLIDHYQVYTRGDTKLLCHFRKWLALRAIGGMRLEVLTDARRACYQITKTRSVGGLALQVREVFGVEADTRAAMGNDDARRSATLRQ